MLKNILKVVSIISSIAILSGCLGGGSSSTPASSSATTYSASSYFTKTAAGNTWTLSGTTTDSGVVNSSGTILDVYTVLIRLSPKATRCSVSRLTSLKLQLVWRLGEWCLYLIAPSPHQVHNAAPGLAIAHTILKWRWNYWWYLGCTTTIWQSARIRRRRQCGLV